MSVAVGEYVLPPHAKALGKGSFATVFVGTHTKTKQEVAIKVMDTSKAKPRELHYMDQEIRILGAVSHPNLVQLLAYRKNGHKRYIVMEFCGGGDIRQYMTRRKREQKKSSSRLPEAVARHFLIQTAAGLQHLHSHRIVHRDLKPQNLLLLEASDTAALKIGDFGFAREEPTELMESFLGSPLYMAPEILMSHKYTNKTDLWSVGLIFYEMLVGVSPFIKARTQVELLKMVIEDKIPYPDYISEHAKTLLKALLTVQRKARIGWDEFFEHPYLRPHHSTKENLSGSKLFGENGESESWTQPILFSREHGGMLTINVLGHHTIRQIKTLIHRISGVPLCDQTLLGDDGIKLEDEKQLRDYGFHEASKKMYLVTKECFNKDRGSKVAKYSGKKVLTPTISDRYVKNPKTVRDYLDRYNAIDEHMNAIYTAAKERYRSIYSCAKQLECQLKVWMVVKTHVITTSAQSWEKLQPVEELYAGMQDNIAKLNKSFMPALEKLSTIQVHPAMVKEGKTLLALLSQNSLVNSYEQYKNTLTMTAADLTFLRNDVKALMTKRDEVVGQLFDNKPASMVDKVLARVHKLCNKLKDDLQTWTRKWQLEREAITNHSSVSQTTLKELDTLYGDFSQASDDIAVAVDECAVAKTTASRVIFLALFEFGQLLSKCSAVDTKLGVNNASLQRLQKSLDELLPVLSYDSVYDACLKEATRRSAYETNLSTVTLKLKKFFDDMQRTELGLRQTFHEVYGSQRMAGLADFLATKPSTVPHINVSQILPASLPPVPSIETTNPAASVSDFEDFVHIIAEPEQRISELETLAEQLQSNNQKLLDELSTRPQRQPIAASSDNVKTEALTTELKAEKERNNKLESENKLITRKFELLKAKTTKQQKKGSDSQTNQIKVLNEQINGQTTVIDGLLSEQSKLNNEKAAIAIRLKDMQDEIDALKRERDKLRGQ